MARWVKCTVLERLENTLSSQAARAREFKPPQIGCCLLVGNMYLIATPAVFLLLFSPQFSGPALLNACLQLVVFIALAHVPSLATGRMSYVDLAWPWGLVTLSLPPLLESFMAPDQSWLDRRRLAALAYFLAGLRMGMGALALLMKGHLKKEMTRYLYQRKR